MPALNWATERSSGPVELKVSFGRWRRYFQSTVGKKVADTILQAWDAVTGIQNSANVFTTQQNAEVKFLYF